MSQSSNTGTPPSGFRRSLNVAVVGTGYISAFHAHALKAIPFVHLAAACDTNRRRAESFAAAWGVPRIETDLNALLERDRPDAVHIITPPAAHYEPALKAIQAGCHVFIEKPLAPTAEECRAIARAARERGVQAGVNHNLALHPAVSKLEQAARSRRFGRIDHVSCVMSVPMRQLSAGQHSHWMFQRPSNILLELGPHPLSQITRLLGPVTQASAVVSGETKLNTGRLFYDTWLISLICARGPAQLLMSFGRDDIDNWIHVTGQDASAHADLRRNTVTFHPKRRWAPPFADCLDSTGNGLRLVLKGWAGFFAYAAGFLKIRPSADAFAFCMRQSIESFHTALAAGRDVPAPASEAAEIIAAIETMEASALARMRNAGEILHA